MRSAFATIAIALLPLLLVLCLSPARARAATGPQASRPAPQARPLGPAAPGLRLLLSSRALSGAARPALQGMRLPGWHGLPDWLGGAWSAALAFQLPRSPASMVAMWLTGGVNRFLNLFSPAPRGPMLVPTGLALLTVTPVVGKESSGYGYRRDPMNRRRRFHKGIDFQARRGTPVYAAGPGVVEKARRWGGYGRVVVISHGKGLETRYAHLRRIKVKEGQFVPAGALIGTVGSTGRATGPHLHFEVRRHDEPLNPEWALGQGKVGPALASGW